METERPFKPYYSIYSSQSASVQPFHLCSLDQPLKKSISNNRNAKINLSHNTKMKAKTSQKEDELTYYTQSIISNMSGLCGGRFSNITYPWQASSWGHSSQLHVRVAWHVTHDCKKALNHTLCNDYTHTYTPKINSPVYISVRVMTIEAIIPFPPCPWGTKLANRQAAIS